MVDLCYFIFRSERTRWVEAINPSNSAGDSERIYDYWGKLQKLALQVFFSLIFWGSRNDEPLTGCLFFYFQSFVNLQWNGVV